MQKTASRKKAVNFLVGGVATISAFGAYHQLREYTESKGKWDKIYNNLQEFNPKELKGPDAKYYPWYRSNDIDDWEYRLVKIRGYFREDRFFVRREREGRTGYMVLAPFITAIEDYEPLRTTAANQQCEYGLMVNLGWVPIENKGDITRAADPLPLLDPPAESEIPQPDRYTGLMNFPENPIEEDVLQLTEVTGIIRRGECANALARRRNWPSEGNYSFVDLPHLSRLFRFFNYDSSKTAYIERMVEKYEEDSEGNYPIPATKDTFIKPAWMPRRHLEYATVLGGLSLLGWLKVLLI